jgi:hypothetical protein
MLAEDRDVGLSEERVEKARRPVGKGANKEDLPFNRWESMRRGSGGEDVDMEGAYY